MKDSLSKYILSLVSFSEEELVGILPHFQELHLSTDRHLVKEGQYMSSYYFVVSGSLRFYLKSGEQEVTDWFAFKDDFFTDLESYENGTPSRHYIQAMSDTDVLYIRKDSMEQLYEQYPRWERLMRLVWQQAFQRVVRGIIHFQSLSAEDRYRHVMENTNLLQQVPLKYLASYIGVTASSLSRLRKNIRQLLSCQMAILCVG